MLQGKLDKTMKASNNQVADRNEQIDKLSQRLGVLQNFDEENQEIMDKERL